MKKFLSFLLFVILVAAIAGGGYYYWLESQDTTMEDVVAEGAVFYWKEFDAATSLKEFSQSKFWKSVSQIDLDHIVESSGTSEANIMVYKALKPQILSLPENLLLEKYFGQEVGVAVYPTDFASYDLQALLDVIKNISFITRVNEEDNFQDFIKRTFLEVDQEYVSRTFQYNDYNITSVTVPQLALPDLKVVFVRIGDYIVFGLDENAARRAIDVASKNKNPITKDGNFIKASEGFIDNSQSINYINLEVIITQFKNQMAQMIASSEDGNQQLSPEEVKKQIDKAFDNMRGLSAIGNSAVYGKLTKIKSDFFYNADQLAPAVKKIYTSCTPKENKTIKFIPKSALFYQWSDCNDLSYYWEELKAEMAADADSLPEGEPAPEEMVAGFETMLGLSIEEDVLPAIGQEQGWVLSDVDLSGAFPMPKFLLFIDVNDQAVAQEILNKLTDQPFLFIQTEEYKGLQIQYVSIPVGAEIQPGYTFINNYLFLGSTIQLLKDIIDTTENQANSLLADETFNDINLGLTDKSNGVLFLRMGALAKKIQKTIDWGSEWFLAKKKQMEAYRAGSQRRLNETTLAIQSREIQLSEAQTKLAQLEKKKEELISIGGDTQAIGIQIDQVKADMSIQEKVIEENQAVESELKEVVNTFGAEDEMNADTIELYLTEVLYPILNGLESVEAIGTKITFGDGVIESLMPIKIVD